MKRKRTLRRYDPDVHVGIINTRAADTINAVKASMFSDDDLVRYYAAILDEDLRGGSLAKLRESIASPSNINELLKRCWLYANSGDDLVTDLVRNKTAICNSGFSLKTANPKVKAQYELYAQQFDFDDLARQMFEILNAIDHVAFWWKAKGRQVQYITVLEPGTYEWYSVGGVEVMKVTPGADVKKLASSTDKEDQKLLKAYDPRWVKAAKEGGKVTLEDKKGEFFIVARARGLTAQGLPRPSMSTVFPDIALRTMLKDGDMAAAFCHRALTTLIQSGETDTKGTNPKRTWIGDAETKRLNELFQDMSRALTVIWNHTLTVKYSYPPAEVFSHAKYESSELNVMRWARYNLPLLDASGKGYATSFMGAKPVAAAVDESRTVVRRALEKLFRHETFAGGVKPEDAPRVKWNPNVLKDDSQVLKEQEFKVKYNVGSRQTAAEVLGDNAEVERGRMTEEKGDLDAYQPIALNKATGLQGVGFDNAGGRPGGPAVVPATDARKKGEPRPSKAAAEDEVGGFDSVELACAHVEACETLRIYPAMAQVMDYVDAESEVSAQYSADFLKENFWHIEVNAGLGEIVGSRKLKDGTVLRFGKKKDGKTGVKIVLIPKGKAKSLDEARKYAKAHYAEALA